jgi:hypothetical protein
MTVALMMKTKMFLILIPEFLIPILILILVLEILILLLAIVAIQRKEVSQPKKTISERDSPFRWGPSMGRTSQERLTL